jgi:uncharacterized GH25 family protein
MASGLDWIAARGKEVSVRGIVVRDGKAVAEATVEFGNSATDATNEPLIRVKTDESGHFDLGYQIRAESWLVVQSGDDRRIRRLDLRDARVQKEATQLRITLRACTTYVEGRVVDHQRNPIEGASVMTAAPVVATLQATGSDGTFKVCADGVSLAIRAPGFGIKTVRPVGIRGDVGDIVLLPETTIRGVVVDARGVGVAGAIVLAAGGLDSTRFEVRTSVTNQGGEYEVNGTPGGCFALTARRAHDVGSSTPRICARPGEKIRAPTIALEKCAIVEGTVRQGAQPLANVALIVDGMRAAYTDAGGGFEIACINKGNVAIPGYTLVQPVHLSARAGETTRVTVDVVAAALVRGTVTLDREPVADATVLAVPADRSGAGQVSALLEAGRSSTGADGAFEIRLSPGRYRLLASDGATGLRSDEKTVDITSETPPLTLELNPGGEIVGLVKDQEDRPLAGVPLSAELADDADPIGLTRRRETISDDSGEFAFRGLSSGMWTVSLRPPWRPHGGALAPVRVGRSTSSELDVKAANATGLTLRGVVQDDGRGAAFATVYLVGYARETVADQNGTFSFMDLPEGKYRVEALSGDGTHSGRASARAGDETVKVVLEPEDGEK